MLFHAGSNGSSLECYEINARGDQFGNCGSSQGAFVACQVEDVTCGQLQCGQGTFMDPGSGGKITILTFNLPGEVCKGFTNSPEDDFLSPGLVADGTRCGNESVRDNVCLKTANEDFNLPTLSLWPLPPSPSLLSPPLFTSPPSFPLPSLSLSSSICSCVTPRPALPSLPWTTL